MNSITQKANQSLGFLRRNLKTNSQKVKEHAYKALIRPKLEYSSSVWDPYVKSQDNQIEKVKRGAAQFVTNRFHNTSSVSDMLVSLNWPLLEIRRTRSRLIMFYKSVHGLVAIQLNPNLLVQNSSRTRQVQGTNLCTFRQISTTKDSYKHSFFPRTIIQWNMLPVAAFQAHTVDAFKVIVIVPVIVSATIY